MPTCTCQCKMCRAPGTRHCHDRTCGAPSPKAVATTLRSLKAAAGSHSPSVAQIERALPGAVRIDACYLANPYATDVLMERVRALDPARLERMVAHYPSQAPALAELVAPYVGVSADHLVVANGACEAIQALLAGGGPVLLSVPTFSAYYELARGPVIVNRLSPANDFALDLDDLAGLLERHRPSTVVIITPNNPDGRPVDPDALLRFLARTAGRVEQVIVDESFAHFSTTATPPTVAHLVDEFPHLVVVNSFGKSHGMAGLRVGYAVAAPHRAQALRSRALWNVNTFAEWFCGLLTDPGYVRDYEAARRTYVREIEAFRAALATLEGARAFPTAANFALLATDRPACDVAAELLAGYGVYVRDCADKRGLDSVRYLRIAARTGPENEQILAGLRSVLVAPPALAA